MQTSTKKNPDLEKLIKNENFSTIVSEEEYLTPSMPNEKKNNFMSSLNPTASKR